MDCFMTFNLKSYVIIIIIAAVILTPMLHRCSQPTISRWSRKEQRASSNVSQRLFQCRNTEQLTRLKRFYDVDCTNPFLEALVKGTQGSDNDDICENFSPLYARITTEFRSFKTFKLTDFKELLEACPECHHLQVINGELYIIPRSTSTNYETRSRSVKTLFKHVIDTFNDIPNLEFLVHVGDSVGMNRNTKHPRNCPVFGFAKNKKDMINGIYTDGIVSIPCFSFWSWPEARITRWDKKIMSIKQAGDSKTFANKKSQLFWRGARTGRRADFTSIAEKHLQIMDVTFMNWQSSGHLALSTSEQYRTLEQHCDYKYLLHLEGNTFSGRLKYLLLCGSPVIYAAIDGWEEFWYHLLKHQENIIILDAINESLLLNTTNYLLENSERASRVGMNGRNIVLKYLNEQAILCYMKNVLLAYSKLVGYQVTKHDQAVPIDDFLLSYLS